MPPLRALLRIPLLFLEHHDLRGCCRSQWPSLGQSQSLPFKFPSEPVKAASCHDRRDHHCSTWTVAPTRAGKGLGPQAHRDRDSPSQPWWLAVLVRRGASDCSDAESESLEHISTGQWLPRRPVTSVTLMSVVMSPSCADGCPAGDVYLDVFTSWCVRQSACT